MTNHSFKTFLTADWRDLFFINYEVAARVLRPFLPPGLEIDLYNGKAYVTLVAFQFLNTKFLGRLSPPLFHSFAELNLRFYVRDPKTTRRGVVFIRETCPHRPVALTAEALFREEFVIAKGKFEAKADSYQYSFTRGKSRTHFSLTPPSNLAPPNEGSLEHFVTVRNLGFNRWNKHSRLCYQVTRPDWLTEEVKPLSIELDLEGLYGEDLKKLDLKDPVATYYSPGSPVDLSWGVRECQPVAVLERTPCLKKTPT